VSDPSTNTDLSTSAIKLTAIWAGTIFGIELSHLVLAATLIYTVLQIGLIISDRVVKPWLAARRPVLVDAEGHTKREAQKLAIGQPINVNSDSVQSIESADSSKEK